MTLNKMNQLQVIAQDAVLSFGFFLVCHVHTCQQMRANVLHLLRLSLQGTYRGKTTPRHLLVFSQHHSEGSMGHSGDFGIIPANHLSSCKHCLEMHRLQGINTNNWFSTHSSRCSFFTALSYSQPCSHNKT